MRVTNLLPLLMLMIVFSHGCEKTVPSASQHSPSATTPPDVSKASLTPKQNEPKISDSSKTAAPPPQLILKAADYASEYKANKEQTQNKYYGKQIEVTGVIALWGRDGTGWFIRLGTRDYHDILCVFGDADPLKAALTGQTVRVQGKVSGVAAVLEVQSCSILSATGPLPPTFTATQLSQEYKSDAKSLNDKYEGNDIIVTGDIVSVKIEENGSAVVTLTKKENMPEVIGNFPAYVPTEKQLLKQLTNGQKIRFLGTYSGFERPGLVTCRILPLTP